jgi:hypothetical protein
MQFQRRRYREALTVNISDGSSKQFSKIIASWLTEEVWRERPIILRYCYELIK